MAIRPQDMISFSEFDASQAIMDAANFSEDRTVFLDRSYTVRSTIHLPPETNLIGDNVGIHQIVRNGNFGDTFQIGNNSIGAGAVVIKNIWVNVTGNVDVSSNTLRNDLDPADRPTYGSHFSIVGAQKMIAENVSAWGMPYVYNLGGCYVTKITGGTTAQFWDHTKPDWQEGIATVRTYVHETHGFCKDLTIEGGFLFGGAATFPRDVSYNGGSVIENHMENVGPKYNILLETIETLNISNGYLGAANENAILINPQAITRNIKIHNLFFDSSRKSNILILRTNSDAYVEAIQINDVESNGQLMSDGFIEVPPSAYGKSFYKMQISNILAENHLMSPIRIFSGDNLSICNPMIKHYNSRNINPNDLQWNSGMVIGQDVDRYNIFGGLIGGAGNPLDDATPNNYTKNGIWNLNPTGGIINEDSIFFGPYGLSGGSNII